MGDLANQLRDCPKGVAQPQWHCLTTLSPDATVVIIKAWLGFDIKIFNYAATLSMIYGGFLRKILSVVIETSVRCVQLLPGLGSLTLDNLNPLISHLDSDIRKPAVLDFEDQR
jgi:hypothetical protein